MDKELLPLFWSLAESNDQQRIGSIDKLLSLLRNKKEKAEGKSKELEYTVKRLVKGLASNRKWARLGYAVALTQLLRNFSIITFQDVNQTMKEELKILKQDSKSEQSNTLLGRVMTCLCIVQADKLSQADSSEVRFITELFHKVKKEKPPLHQICSQGLVQVISKVTSEQFSSAVWPVLEEECQCGWDECQPDTLLILLTIRNQHKNALSKAFLNKHWGSKRLITESSMAKIGSVLAKSTADHPVIHPLCEVLLSEITKKPETFTAFWKTVVDGYLLNQTLPKKYLCLQLIPKALTLVTLPEQVKVILSPNLLKLLLNHMPNKQQPLNSAVKQLLQRLVQQVGTVQDDAFQVAVLTSMLQSSSHVQFDSVTRTSTMVDLIRQLKSGATETFAQMLMDTIQGDNKLIEDSSVDQETVVKWVVQSLASLVTQVSKATDSDWQVQLLEFLFLHGFFRVKKTTKEVPHSSRVLNLSGVVVESLQECFFRALNKLSSFSPGKGVKSRRHYTDVLRQFIAFVQRVLSDQKHFCLHKELHKDALSHLKKIFSVISKIQKPQNGTSEKMGTEEAFELLFIHLGLKLFTDPKEGIDAVQDLYVCYEKAFKKEKASHRKEVEEDEPEWVEVITDLLLSLLVQKSHLVRSVVKTVFTLLSPNLTSRALGFILEVLRSTGSGEEALLNFEEEEGEETMDTEEDQGDEDVTDGNQTEESESESESSEDDLEDTKNGVEEALKRNVKSALGKAAVESEDEETDDDLSDSEMEKLDSALSAAFKGMTKKKSEEKMKRVQLKHYKMRCLDLIEVLVQNETSPVLLLEVIEPLLRVLEHTQKEKDMKELYTRATTVYRALMAPRKLTNTEGCDKSLLVDRIEELITFSTKVTGIPMVLEVGRAVLFVIRVMLGMDSNTAPPALCPFIKKPGIQATPANNKDVKNLKKVHEVIERSVQDYCQKRESLLNHMLFHEMLENQTLLMWPLMSHLLRLAQDTEIRVFCRTHLCSMMATMITKNTVAALGEETWRESALEITGQLNATFNAALEEKHRKPKFLHDVLLVLHKVFQFSSQEVLEEIVPDSFLESIESAKEKSKTRDLKGIINKLSQLVRRRLHMEQSSSKRKEKKRKRELREQIEDVKRVKLEESHDIKSEVKENETEVNNHIDSGDSPRRKNRTQDNVENGDITSNAKSPENKSHKKKKNKRIKLEPTEDS